MLRAIIHGFRNLLSRDRGTSEVGDEVRSFYEAAVEHRIAEGMTVEEARRETHRDLGSEDRAGERIYGSRWESVPDEILRDMRFGLRMLARNLGFTTVAVLTLAVAIGATTTVFSVVNAALLRPLPFPQQDRLMFLWEKSRDGTRTNIGYATFEDWRKMSRSFSHISVLSSWSPTLVGQTDAEALSGMRVSSGTFDMLGAKMELGRDFTAQEDVRGYHQVVILSHALWRRKFGSDSSIVGKGINLGGMQYLVVGVLPPEITSVFSIDGRAQDIYAPIAYNDTLPWACRDCRHLRALARLAPGITEQQARADMDRVAGALFQQFPKIYTSGEVLFTPAREYVVGNMRPVLIALVGAVGFVLLIACVNVANLLLGLGARRQHEFALRASLGARRTRLLRQLLTESIVLFLLGGSAGVAMAFVAVNALSKYASTFIPSVGAMAVDMQVCAFALLVSLSTAVIFGLLPAIRIASQDAMDTSKQGKTSPPPERERLRNSLIIVDVAMALALVTGAALMTKSFTRLMRVNPGFDLKHTLALNIDLWGEKYKSEDQQVQFFDNAVHEVETLPDIEAAAVTSQVPLGGNLDRYGMNILDKPNANPAENPDADRYSISPDYFRVMGIPVLKGRVFDSSDRRSTQAVAIINQTFAESIWPGEDPIGKQIQMGEKTSPPKVVVGVVGDVLHQGLDAGRTMQIYLPNTQMTDSSVVMVVRVKGSAAAVQQEVTSAIARVDGLQPTSNVITMSELMKSGTMRRRFATGLFVGFAGIGLLLAAVGTYGVVSYVVAQRTREIGIRMALGALPADVLRMVLRQGLGPAAIGTIAGITISSWIASLMKGLLFDVRPIDRVVFGTAPLCMLSIVLLACFVPARRATKINPTEALRYE